MFGDEEATSVECYTEAFNYTYKVKGSGRVGADVRYPPALISSAASAVLSVRRC